MLWNKRDSELAPPAVASVGPHPAEHGPADFAAAPGDLASGAGVTPSDQATCPQISAQEVQFAVAFARMVAILMRSNPYRHSSLSDLEWLVVPPLMTGQFAILDAQVNGQTVPVALALWASVSAEVDQRLSDPTLPALRLKPDEWRSGDIFWLIDAVGDAQAIPHLLRGLNEGPFADKQVKMRCAGEGGIPKVELLSGIFTGGAMS